MTSIAAAVPPSAAVQSPQPHPNIVGGRVAQVVANGKAGHPLVAGMPVGATGGYASLQDASRALVELTEGSKPAALIYQSSSDSQYFAYQVERPLYRDGIFFKHPTGQSVPYHLGALGEDTYAFQRTEGGIFFDKVIPLNQVRAMVDDGVAHLNPNGNP